MSMLASRSSRRRRNRELKLLSQSGRAISAFRSMARLVS
jgi:hypothetical protein